MKGSILPNKVLLSVVDARKEINGIIVPNYTRVNPIASIEVTGDGCSVSVGQKVMFDGGGVKVSIEDKEYILINENQILYIYE